MTNLPSFVACLIRNGIPNFTYINTAKNTTNMLALERMDRNKHHQRAIYSNSVGSLKLILGYLKHHQKCLSFDIIYRVRWVPL